MVFPQHFRDLGIPSLDMVVCSVDIPHVHGDLCIITKPCLHRVFVKSYQLWKFSQWDTLSSKPSTSHGHQLDGDEIVNAPLSCYIVKWRNRKVAI